MKMHLIQEQHPDFFANLKFLRLDDMKSLAAAYKESIHDWETKF
jgi:hypothetical protein